MNNERESKNETYKEVLAGLDNLVLVMWDDDTTIIPKVVANQNGPLSPNIKLNSKESAHFGFYALEQDAEVTIF